MIGLLAPIISILSILLGLGVYFLTGNFVLSIVIASIIGTYVVAKVIAKHMS